MNEQLKPCPFCGGEIELKRHVFDANGPLIAFVCPETSGCHDPKWGSHMFFYTPETGLAEAIQRWNARAETPIEKAAKTLLALRKIKGTPEYDRTDKEAAWAALEEAVRDE